MPDVETPKERHNRELIELLNELRVVLPGVQVLFAFLLAVPLSFRFEKISGVDRDLFFVTLCCTAVATALLIAPSALHRIDFRAIDKGSMVILSNGLVIAGLGFVALSMALALTFVTDLLYSETAAFVVGALAVALFGGTWFVLPFRRRRRKAALERRSDRTAPLV